MKKILLSLVVLFSLTSCNSTKEVESKTCKSDRTFIENEVTDTKIAFTVQKTYENCYKVDYSFGVSTVGGTLSPDDIEKMMNEHPLPVVITIHDLDGGSFRIVNQSSTPSSFNAYVIYNKNLSTFTIMPNISYNFNKVKIQDNVRITVKYDTANKTFVFADDVK